MATFGPLYLPAIRAVMGDWVYYVATMRLKDVATRVGFANEIHRSEALRELLQRELDTSKHATAIKNYLLKDPQRLFSSMVVGVYGGDPEWHELRIRDASSKHDELDSVDFEGLLGFLTLTGSETLFAIDGQHRVHGIKEAVKVKSRIGRDEVGVIFVAHKTDAKGHERTRRLFTRLNRFAKPVRKEEIIALDEDDVVAILTRRFVEEDKSFAHKVSIQKTKALSSSEKRSFTTIGAFYDCLDVFLCIGQRNWAEFKRLRPSDAEINTFYESAQALWRTLARYSSSFHQLYTSPAGDNVAGKHRRSNGGDLLFRPVGLLMVIKTIARFVETGVSLRAAVRRVCAVPMTLGREPWVGLLWDRTNARMITAPEQQKLAARLLYYSAGGRPSDLGTTIGELKKELAGLTNRKESDVRLVRYWRRGMA